MQNEHWKTIFGWFDFESTYDLAIDHLKDGDIAIELGTFLGKSTCYLAQRLKESGKKRKFMLVTFLTGLLPHLFPKNI